VTDDAAAVELITKQCTACREELPLSAFHAGAGVYGRTSQCRTCVSAYRAELRARRIAEEGIDAVRKRTRDQVAASRKRTGNSRGRQYQRAYRRAEAALRNAHPDQFAALLQRELYEDGLL
jgi:hypothetical protein